jgi:hypothetical protein
MAAAAAAVLLLLLLLLPQLIEKPLPKLPREAGVAVHWLAIDGVQPDLPENTPLDQPPAKRQKLSSQRGAAAGGDGLTAAGAAAGAAQRFDHKE